LTLLLEATHYAQDLRESTWAFAVELGALRHAGMTNNDIRWLCAKGFVEHAIEVALSGKQAGRAFHAKGSHPLSQRACFIITPAGTAFAKRMSSTRPALVRGHTDQPIDRDDHSSLVPDWDSASRTLSLGATIIKQFKVPAMNQEVVLSAFAEEGWPNCIDDPLPPMPGVDAKRRLHDTIVRLNRGQTHPLIRFHGNGRGLAIHWQPTTNARQIDT
jgi:hypothetical protein